MLRIDTFHGIAYQIAANHLEPYDDNYYNKYISYEGTPLAKAINGGRIAIVEKYKPGVILDVGVGSLEFIKTWGRQGVYGFDVNPRAVNELKKRGIYHDIVREGFRPFDAVCFWDSLEHIMNGASLVRECRDYVFTSIPIFKDIAKVKHSKHYRPGEHLIYFTDTGLKTFMKSSGFDFIEKQDFEIIAGREDIYTYVFRKAHA